MQMRRLEILEGLPDEVFNEILLTAYMKCAEREAVSRSVRLKLERGPSGRYMLHLVDSLGFPHETLTELCETKLEAWKQAYERLTS